MNLYVTADKIGMPTGGGIVTHHESEALKSLGPSEIWDWDKLLYGAPQIMKEPWCWDAMGEMQLEFMKHPKYKLAHFYAGTFGNTVKKLKEQGCKIVYTIAAHDKEISRREHEKLGWPFPYPHLTEEALWQRYIEGYHLADVIVCPATIAASIVRNYGPEFRDKRIEVISHGITLPGSVGTLPSRFTVGYLGAIGADKGLTYLIQAWGKLDYSDATLVIAGRDSTHPWVIDQVHKYVKRPWTVDLRGWVNNVSDFYNSLSLYVQPSATEGFGIEVLEALAYGRPVVCSHGAGAQDILQDASPGLLVRACDVNALAGAIDNYRCNSTALVFGASHAREVAQECTWDKIRQRYVDLWKEVLR